MKRKLLMPMVAIFFVVFTSSGIGFCQTIINNNLEFVHNKKCLELLSSRSIWKGIATLGLSQDRLFNIHLNCSSKYNVKQLSVHVLKPLEFIDDKKYPSKGVWEISYLFTRCGESKTYNVMFAANVNGDEPTYTNYYPGTPRADPLLIKKAMIGALQYVFIKTGGCDTDKAVVFDMNVTEQPHNVMVDNKIVAGVWKETWIFMIAGKLLDVEMTFIPDGKGGTSYIAGPIKSTAQ